MEYAEVARTAIGDDRPRGTRARRCARAPPAVVFVQRSRGYAARRSLSIDAIARSPRVVRSTRRAAIVFVDNCYGELVEEREPLEVGADLIAGSLIKNLGGGLAPTGGYVAGRADLDRARRGAPLRARASGPLSGRRLGFGRTLMQGRSTRRWSSAKRCAASTSPPRSSRSWATRSIRCRASCAPTSCRRFGSARASRLVAFARGLQRALPINARFAPEPGPVPGYVDPVIMSSGAFVSGSTIDLSCDAPLRAPWDVYLQGGIVAEHVAFGRDPGGRGGGSVSSGRPRP